MAKRNLFAALMAIAFVGSAHAANDTWLQKLEDYRLSVKDQNILLLSTWAAANTLTAIGTCSADVALFTTAVVADTLPGTNVVSETIANLTNENYRSLSSNGSLIGYDNFKSVGRGTVGAASLFAMEYVEFVFNWLGGGDNSNTFNDTLAAYESMAATYNALFSKNGACYMSLGKLAILANEEVRQKTLIPSSLNP